MKSFKHKIVFITCSVIIVVIFWFIVVNAFIKNTPDMSGNGRNFCITFPEGLILQSPPPKNKLIKFMKKNTVLNLNNTTDLNIQIQKNFRNMDSDIHIFPQGILIGIIMELLYQQMNIRDIIFLCAIITVKYMMIMAVI